MNRRGFISSVLACSAAPAVVRADALMKIRGEQHYLLSDLVSIWMKPENDRFYIAHAIRLDGGNTLFHVGNVLHPSDVHDASRLSEINKHAHRVIQGYADMRGSAINKAIKYEDSRAHPDMNFDPHFVRIH